MDCPDGACAVDETGRVRTVTENDLQIRKTAAFGLYELWCDDRPRAERHSCRRLISEANSEALAVARAKVPEINELIAEIAVMNRAESKRDVLQKAIEQPSFLAAPLSLQWGVGVSPQQGAFTRMGAVKCPVTQDSGLERLETFFSRAATAVLSAVKLRPTGQTDFKCAYQLTIPLQILMYGENREALKKALKGKLVLIGSSGFAGLGDVVESPVHGQLPGVYAHAQALDNLMRYGGNRVFDVVRHSMDESLLSFRNFFYLILMTLFMFISFRIGRLALRGAISFDDLIQRGSELRLRVALRRSSYGLLRVVALGAVALTIPVVAAAFFFWITRTAPLDWVGIVVAMSVVMVGIVWRTLGQIGAELAVAFPPTSKFARNLLAQIRD
jgi:hypothetical protein